MRRLISFRSLVLMSLVAASDAASTTSRKELCSSDEGLNKISPSKPGAEMVGLWPIEESSPVANARTVRELFFRSIAYWITVPSGAAGGSMAMCTRKNLLRSRCARGPMGLRLIRNLTRDHVKRNLQFVLQLECAAGTGREGDMEWPLFALKVAVGGSRIRAHRQLSFHGLRIGYTVEPQLPL